MKKNRMLAVLKKTVNSSGPMDMPSVQSPRVSPDEWKKFAFHWGIAAVKRRMLTTERTMDAMESPSLRRQRESMEEKRARRSVEKRMGPAIVKKRKWKGKTGFDIKKLHDSFTVNSSVVVVKEEGLRRGHLSTYPLRRHAPTGSMDSRCTGVGGAIQRSPRVHRRTGVEVDDMKQGSTLCVCFEVLGVVSKWWTANSDWLLRRRTCFSLGSGTANPSQISSRTPVLTREEQHRVMLKSTGKKP